MYVLNPNDFIPTCIPLGQEIKFISHISSKTRIDPPPSDLIEIIIAPNTSEISPKNIINDLLNEHGLKITIATDGYSLNANLTRYNHFSSNYGPVGYAEERVSIVNGGVSSFIPGSHLTFIADDKRISLGSFRYNLDTLIEMASSMGYFDFNPLSIDVVD